MNTHADTTTPLAGCGPVGEGTGGKVLNWTVRSLNHAYTTDALSNDTKVNDIVTLSQASRGLL